MRVAPSIERLPEMDRLAEKLLLAAEQLTKNLETAGFAGALHVINVSGRQRMLSQRLAKHAIVASLVKGEAATANKRAAKVTEKAFVDGLAYLESIPLSTPKIRKLLTAATAAWTSLRGPLEDGGSDAARAEIARLSEMLLSQFDQLTGLYERGMQMLME